MISDIRITVEDIFQTAADLQPEDRARYLDRVCRGDESLRREVEELLELHDGGGEFLQTPALQDAARDLARDLAAQAEPVSDTLREEDWRLGPYRILYQLGKGGMGIVYLAVDTRDDREVAIKVLPKDRDSEEDTLARFIREGRMLAELKHPNIAEIHEQNEYDGKPCIVLEYVPGDTLADRLADGPLSIRDALQYGVQIADALASAHSHRIVHRDLKPANIKITPDGRIKVLDFGLAKHFNVEPRHEDEGDTASLSLTESGMLLGTPAYMSPEQWGGQKLDHRTDLWALGCLLFEMLSGVAPFAGRTRAETMKLALGADANWSALPAGTPLLVQDLIRRLLDRNPASRLADAGEARRIAAEALSQDRFTLLLYLKSQYWRLGRAAKVSMLTAGMLLAMVSIWRTTPVKDWLRVGMGAPVYTEKNDLTDLLARKVNGADPAQIRAALIPDHAFSQELLAQSESLRRNQDYPNAIASIIDELNAEIRNGKETAWHYAILAQAHLFQFYLSSNPADKDAAMAAGRKADALNPEAPEVRIALGNLFNAIASYDQAIQIFEGLRRRPEFTNAPPVLAGLAWAHMEKGSDEEAEQLFLQAIEACKNQGGRQCWEYQSDLGEFYFHHEKYDQAQAQWRDVIDANPMSSTPYLNLGSVALMRGCLTQAVNYYSESINRLKQADAFGNRGAALLFQGRYNEAVNDLEQATIRRDGFSSEENLPFVWGNLGDAYRLTARPADAEQAYRKALDGLNRMLAAKPTEADLLLLKAEWLAKLKAVGGETPENPLALLENGLRSNPDCAKCQAIAVVVYHLSGKRAEALRATARAVALGKSPFIIVQNPDLAGLRQERLFQQLLARAPAGC
ncbi:MAG: protein kinase domain-containing protein [Blastocatellia bacterium]